MTIIENVFMDQEQTLRGVIANMPVIGCVSNFIGYINKKTDDASQLEKKFIQKLSISDVLAELKMTSVAKKNKEELLDELKDLYEKGYYALSERYSDELEEYLIEYSDKEVYPVLQNYMANVLERLIAEETRTKEEKMKEKKESRIGILQQEIQCHERSIQKLKEELERLQN